jgi:hypothetical protein
MSPISLFSVLLPLQVIREQKENFKLREMVKQGFVAGC